jgi:hypothetical protein
MLSYHSDPAVKSKYLARLEGHAEADEIIKGQYWEAGKGCAVGCTVHGASHDDYERTLGIPRMLAWLEDVIFEGLPNRRAKTWPHEFLSSIEPGKDLSRVGWQFLHWLLTERNEAETDFPAGVRQCAAVLVPLANGQAVDKAAAADAAAMAWASAKTTGLSENATWIVESAARAAESAALAQECATLSAEHAAIAVTAAIARSADYIALSQKLLELLKAA